MQEATMEVLNPDRIRLPDLKLKRGEWQYHPDRNTVVRALRNDPLGSMHARGQITDVRYQAGREWQRYAEMAGTPLKSPGDIQEPVDGTRMPRDGTSDKRRKAIARRAVWRDMLGGKAFALLVAVLEDKASLNEAGALIFPRDDRKNVNWLFRKALDQVAADLGLST